MATSDKENLNKRGVEALERIADSLEGINNFVRFACMLEAV